MSASAAVKLKAVEKRERWEAKHTADGAFVRIFPPPAVELRKRSYVEDDIPFLLRRDPFWYFGIVDAEMERQKLLKAAEKTMLQMIKEEQNAPQLLDARFACEEEGCLFLASSAAEAARHKKCRHELDFSSYPLVGSASAKRWIRRNSPASLSAAELRQRRDSPAAPPEEDDATPPPPPLYLPSPTGLDTPEGLDIDNLSGVADADLEGISMRGYPYTILQSALLAPSHPKSGDWGPGGKHYSLEGKPSPGQTDCTVIGYSKYRGAYTEERRRGKATVGGGWGKAGEGYEERYPGVDQWGVENWKRQLYTSLTVKAKPKEGGSKVCVVQDLLASLTFKPLTPHRRSLLHSRCYAPSS